MLTDDAHEIARADAVEALRRIADQLEALPAETACEALLHCVDVIEELRRRAALVL